MYICDKCGKELHGSGVLIEIDGFTSIFGIKHKRRYYRRICHVCNQELKEHLNKAKKSFFKND